MTAKFKAPSPLFDWVRSAPYPSLESLNISHDKLNPRDGEDRTPLIFAAECGRVDAALQLIKAGAEVLAVDNLGHSALWLAAAGRYPLLVRALLDAGAKQAADTSRLRAPLHQSAIAGSLENIRLLIDHGVDLNVLDLDHSTPLHLATIQENAACVQELLRAGAKVNICDLGGHIPEWYAARFEQKNIQEIFYSFSEKKILSEEMRPRGYLGKNKKVRL